MCCAFIAAAILIVPLALVLLLLEVAAEALPFLGVPIYAVGVALSIVVCVLLFRFQASLRQQRDGGKYLESLWKRRGDADEENERRREFTYDPDNAWAYVVTAGLAFLYTAGFYIATCSQLMRYWDLSFGGFTGTAGIASTDAYGAWLGFGAYWAFDNLSFGAPEAFQLQPWSHIMPTEPITQFVVWAFNIGLVVIVLTTMWGVGKELLIAQSADAR